MKTTIYFRHQNSEENRVTESKDDFPNPVATPLYKETKTGLKPYEVRTNKVIVTSSGEHHRILECFEYPEGWKPKSLLGCN